MMKDTSDELARLRAENARLVALLDAHGIAWGGADAGASTVAAVPLRTDEKVLLFRRLFRGRTDVYPVRWESQAGKAGYSPACADVVALVKSTEVSIAKLLARVPLTTQASMESSRRPDRPAARQLAVKATRINCTVADTASGRLAAALHNPAPMPLTSNPVRPAFYRLRDIVRISALSRSTIYRRISDGRFPPPVHLGGRASGCDSNPRPLGS